MLMGLLFVSFLLLVVAEASSFEAHIGLTNAAYEVDFSLRNTENQPITILIFGTPLESSCHSDVLCSDMFNVVSELNVAAVYTGVVSKRFFPPSAFKTLQPNQTVTAQVNLSHSYWFPQPGTYRVSLKSFLFVYKGQSTNVSLFTRYDLPTDEIIQLAVWTSSPSPAVLRPFNVAAKIESYTNCSANQTAYLQAMDPDVLQTTLQAYNYLASGDCSNRPLYGTWFGACTTERYNYVVQNFLNILNRIRAGTYTVECEATCGDYVIAWVYTTIPTIHLCPLYWQMPRDPCVEESQVGTIIHEISHWTDVADTDDYCYGKFGCQQLARTAPDNVTHNADTYCGFANDCPQTPDGAVATTVTFASYSPVSMNKGSLDVVSKRRTFTLSCKEGLKDCDLLRVQPALNTSPFSFAPSPLSSVLVPISTKMPAQSVVTVTLSNSPASPKPIYLYASNWPVGTYTFPKKGVRIATSGSASAGNVKISGRTLKISGTTTWSGILRFTERTMTINWKGQPKNKDSRLTFTLAWVDKS